MSDRSFLFSRTPSKLRHLPTSESCFDRDIQPVFSESHVSFVLAWPQYGQRGREGGGEWRAIGREKENGRGTARKQEKKIAISYPSDSNLDVNCRLMSQRSGKLLGNHGGIQENEARKKIS